MQRRYYFGRIASVLLLLCGCWYATRPHVFLYAGTEWHWLGSAVAGKPLTISYRHSVQRTYAEEYLEVNPTLDGWLLTGTKYRSLAVGLPFLPTEGTYRHVDDDFILTLQRKIPQLDLRVGVGTELTLRTAQTYPLWRTQPPGTLVSVRILPLWQGLANGILHHSGGERNDG